MSHSPIINNEDSPVEVIPLLGGTIKVMSSSDLGDENNITVQLNDGPGFGPPPHSHSWSETFYVISGSVTFIMNGEELSCGPGSIVYVPSGAVHGFQSGPDGVKMVEITGAKSKALGLFRELSAFLENGPPEDMKKVKEIFMNHEADLHL